MDNELKPRSFRINEETAEKFKQITAEIGGNQQATLFKLIEAYEFQKGKEVLVNKKEDIDEFEKYLGILTRKYMASLENEENAVTTARVEYEALLKSKDETIMSIQEQLQASKLELQVSTDYVKKLETDYKNIVDNNAYISQELNDLDENHRSIIKDKDELNIALKETCNKLKSEIIEKNKEIKSFADQKSDYEKLVTDKERAEQNLHGLEKRLKKIKEEQETELVKLKEKAAIELEKALLEKDKLNNIEINKIEKEKNEEIAKYQTMYAELLQKIQSNSSKSRQRKSPENQAKPVAKVENK